VIVKLAHVYAQMLSQGLNIKGDIMKHSLPQATFAQQLFLFARFMPYSLLATSWKCLQMGIDWIDRTQIDQISVGNKDN